MGVRVKTSSDIAMGRRPEPKSDEFSSHTPLIYEDNCNFVFETSEMAATLFGSTTPKPAIFAGMLSREGLELSQTKASGRDSQVLASDQR